MQLYDIEHWPDKFNSLLLHDFPSLDISVDASDASLSGFAVTLRWNPANSSQLGFINETVHVLVSFLLISLVLYACCTGFNRVSMEELRELKLFMQSPTVPYNTSAHLYPYSSLVHQLKSLMAHSEL
jgi:hypothetical protein